MRINNFGQFYSFIKQHSINNNGIINNFAAKVEEYKNFCNCHKSDKEKKFNECNQLYINVVKNVIPTMKTHLFGLIPDTLIEFYYSDSFHITTITK